MERLLLVVRHAQSEKKLLNHHGHCASIDYLLTKAGSAHAAELAQIMCENVRIRHISSSGSMAPLQTARAIASKYQIEVQVLEELRAVDMGIVAGMSSKDIEERHPEISHQIKLYDEGLLHPKDFTIPGREEFDHFYARIRNVLRVVAALPSPGVIVAHRSAIIKCVAIDSAGTPINFTSTFHIACQTRRNNRVFRRCF